MSQEGFSAIYQDILAEQLIINVHTVNEEMTISQVIKYFDRYDIQFTKTMIQNYIRIGLLPGPVEKRYYIQNHLILLYIIYHLKDSFSLEEMKTVFSPIFQNLDTFEDDLISPIQLYALYTRIDTYVRTNLQQLEKQDRKAWMDTLIVELEIPNKANDSIYKFVNMLYCMVQTACLHRVARRLIGEWYK